MPKLSLAKLERHLYAAADILRREGMDAATSQHDIASHLAGEDATIES